MAGRTDLTPGGRSAAGAGVTGLVLLMLFGSIVMALLSEGVHHDDELVHYLMARWSWSHWEYLLHPWGRPGLTVPLALVSWIGDVSQGWLAARILSACATACGAWLAACLAIRVGVRPAWLVVLACYLQPLTSVLSYTTLTENFAALYLIAAASLLINKRVVAASLVFSLAMITRHELVVFYPIWIVAVWYTGVARRRAVFATAASFFAIAAYNLLFFVLLGDWPGRLYFAGTGSSRYTAVGLLSYVPHLCYAVTPTLVALAVIGGMRMARRGRLLIPAVAGAYLAVHLLLRAFGLFASGGFGRFMVTVSPLIAILCVEGIAEFTRNDSRPTFVRRACLIMAGVFAVAMLANWTEVRAGRIDLPGGAMRWVIELLPLAPIAACCMAALRQRAESARFLARGTGVLLGMLCITQWMATVRPLQVNGCPQRTREAVWWLDEAGLADRPVFAATPWVAYWMGQIEKPRLDKGPALLASMPVGTVVLWDWSYCPSDFHRLPRRFFDGNPAYRQIAEFEVNDTGTDANAIVVYEKTAVTLPPAHEKQPYPPNLMIRDGRVSGIYYTRETRAMPSRQVDH